MVDLLGDRALPLPVPVRQKHLRVVMFKYYVFEKCVEMFLGCLLGGVYQPCVYRMQGGVIVGDSGLCCCVNCSMCDSQLFERNYFPVFVET